MSKLEFRTFRRKPTEIKATQWVVRTTNADDAKPIVDYINQNGGQARFIYDFVDNDVMKGQYVPRIFITTLEGTMQAKPGDYICQGLVGEFWPVRKDVFEMTNEEVVEPTFEVTTVGTGGPD